MSGADGALCHLVEVYRVKTSPELDMVMQSKVLGGQPDDKKLPHGHSVKKGLVHFGG